MSSTDPTNSSFEPSQSGFPELLPTPGRLSQPLLPARFVQRLHRFAMEVELENGERHTAHMADPGRLQHLLHPGVELRVEGPFEHRKTRYSAILVRASTGVWVSLVSTLPNRMFVPLLEQGLLPLFPADSTWKREVTHGNSRFDYYVTTPEKGWWVELKSVSWAEDGTGLFPDAPTTRGTKHLKELTELAQQGENTAVLLVAQRADIQRICPASQIDPAFAQALIHAWEQGVELLGVGVGISPEGVWYERELPIVWNRR